MKSRGGRGVEVAGRCDQVHEVAGKKQLRSGDHRLLWTKRHDRAPSVPWRKKGPPKVCKSFGVPPN